jgi:agmatine deiminase
MPPTLSSPSERYRMPAEWEPHAATWIAWPHKESDWPGKLAAIPWVFTEIVRWLAASERVEILCNNGVNRRAAREALKRATVPTKNVRLHLCPTDRAWLRDSGPIFVKAGEQLVALRWKFNAWAKYPDWKKDQHVPQFIAKFLGVPCPQVLAPIGRDIHRVVLEGGSIDVNGRGTLLTTQECLLSKTQARNPGLKREFLEAALESHLGVQQIIWLKRGIVGDDTHGHVDDIARFVGPRMVVAAFEPDRRDPNYAPLRANLEALQRATDQHGHRLTIVPLPMPRPIVFRGQRLPASYANFYIANRHVLVPTFNDPNDRGALDTLAEVFPDRTIVPIYCGDFIWGLGAIHCMTQQQPL